MTAQRTDTLYYSDQRYSIVGPTVGPIRPSRLGLNVRPLSTACRRGFHCSYCVRDNELYLVRMTVGLHEPESKAAEVGEGQELFGVAPERTLIHPNSERQYWSPWFYAPTSHRVDFSGTLTVGTHFLDSQYGRSLGFAPHKFKTVLDLVFVRGELTDVRDRSSEMEASRVRCANRWRALTKPIQWLLNRGNPPVA